MTTKVYSKRELLTRVRKDLEGRVNGMLDTFLDDGFVYVKTGEEVIEKRSVKARTFKKVITAILTDKIRELRYNESER